MDMAYLLDARRRVLDGIKATDTLTSLMAGKLEPRVYVRYLTNVWHYARHSAVIIGTAGARCVTDNPALAHYLLRHAREELGHDQWALDDLAALGIGEDEVRATRPTLSCAAMVGYEHYIAMHANPVGLFGWMYILEAMGDDLGFLASKGISDGMGLAGGVKFLAGHGEADAKHTIDLTEQITENVREEDAGDVDHVAAVVSDLYVRMFEDIGRD